MSYLFNLVYLLLLILLSPWIVFRAIRNGRYRRGLGAKFLGLVPRLLPEANASGSPTVWFHGVSVGEVHLLRQAVALARKRNPSWRIVVSTSTDTGYDEAKKAFADLEVFFWPLDFSWAIKTALRRVKPDLVVLAEGEIWPNFLRIATNWSIPVALLNGRISPRSYGRYCKVRWLARGLFSRFDLILAQSKDYAAYYQSLGGRNVIFSGNIKYDGASAERNNAKTMQMRQLLGIRPGELIWVVGSTQPPEEEIALRIFQKARAHHSQLRLILVPRQKDRFDVVASMLESSGEAFTRRSEIATQERILRARNEGPEIVLIDTIGELSAVWGLADVAYVGGSLDGVRGGQNMIEPAAYGSAVTFGPHTWNFKETVTRLLEIGGAIQVRDEAEWESVTLDLLGNASKRMDLGRRAREFVLSQQGATQRSIEALEALLAKQKILPLAA